ncbi:hypothetical protein MTO96_048086 [Rhipicephalus appendiculatus]
MASQADEQPAAHQVERQLLSSSLRPAGSLVPQAPSDVPMNPEMASQADEQPAAHQAGSGQQTGGATTASTAVSTAAHTSSVETANKRRTQKEEQGEPFPYQQCLAFGLTAILATVMLVYVLIGSSPTVSTTASTTDRKDSKDDDNGLMIRRRRDLTEADDARERELVFVPTDGSSTTPALRHTSLVANDTPPDGSRDADEGVADVTGRTTSSPP